MLAPATAPQHAQRRLHGGGAAPLTYADLKEIARESKTGPRANRTELLQHRVHWPPVADPITTRTPPSEGSTLGDLVNQVCGHNKIARITSVDG